MAPLWISDAVGRVLGPLAEPTLRELVSTGRLKSISSASRDGKAWRPVAEFPELAQLFASPSPELRRKEERVTVEKVRAELAQMQGKSALEVFALPRTATLLEHRAAFFARVKGYYPDRLAADADPGLRRAYEDAFLFLANLMAKAEERLSAAAPATSSPSKSPARAAPPPSLDKPTYQPREFVGFLPLQGNRLQCNLKVNRETAGMFFDHRLMNITNGSVFITSLPPVPLGTQLEVVFAFEEENKAITAVATIAFENRMDEKQPLGFGLRFTRVAPEDLAYLKAFAQRAKPLRKLPPGA